MVSSFMGCGALRRGSLIAPWVFGRSSPIGLMSTSLL